MDPIRLLDEPGIALGSSARSKKTQPGQVATGQTPPRGLTPPSRVWDSIEATLKSDGLIA